MGEDDQNPNTLRDFSLTKIRFYKSSSKYSKNTGGGSRPFGKTPNVSRFFLGMASLIHISETILSNQFLYNLFVLFSTLSSRRSKTMCKLHQKLCNAKKF